MKNVVIIGAGDLGKEVVWLIEDINRIHPTYLILGFLDDNREKLGNEFYGYKVLGGIDDLETLAAKIPLSAVIAIKDGSVRKKIENEHPTFSKWESIIHPTAIVASTSKIGDGSILFPHTTISVDSIIGRSALCYIHSVISNDCQIGDYVSVMCGAYILDHAIVASEYCVDAGTSVSANQKCEELYEDTGIATLEQVDDAETLSGEPL